MNKKFYIITEIDNLYYDFVNYYFNIVWEISLFVNETFGIKSDEFIDKFISKLEGFTFPTSDYIYTTYEVLKEYKEKVLNFESNSTKVSFLNSIRTKFNQIRLKHLKFSPNAVAFLKIVKESGIGVIGVTNSPARVLKQRLKIFEIDKYFDSVYCLKDSFEEKVNDNGNSIAEVWYHSVCNNVSSLMCDIIEVPYTYQKPSKRGLERVIEEEEIPLSKVLVIGNSIENDILPAKLIGLSAVLISNKIKITRIDLLRRFLGKISKKKIRKIVNLHNNKPLMWKMSDIKVFSSFSDLIYSLNNLKVIA